MILDDVAEGAGGLVEGAAAFDADGSAAVISTWSM